MVFNRRTLPQAVDQGQGETRPDITVDESELLARLRAGDDARLRGARPDLLAPPARRRAAHRRQRRRRARRHPGRVSLRVSQPANFHGDARLSTWLHRIVVNSALMKLRTRKRKPEESIEPLLPAFLADGHYAEKILRRGASRPTPRCRASRDAGSWSAATSTSCPRASVPFCSCATSKGWTPRKPPACSTRHPTPSRFASTAPGPPCARCWRRISVEVSCEMPRVR